jgi:hypothetical protein
VNVLYHSRSSDLPFYTRVPDLKSCTHFAHNNLATVDPSFI